jgi:uncharacterized Ntn-hydrolase superfamily protein
MAVPAGLYALSTAASAAAPEGTTPAESTGESIAMEAAPGPSEPVGTFSIVGFDPDTGELGVAVQSKFFAVGVVVPWAKAGVGAIATQAFANTTYGPEGLRLLAEGRSPEDVITELTDPDESRDRRQIGIVDATGRSASFTGDECMAWAGHVVGEHYAAQGNILTGEEVVRAMARAFESAEGILGEKLLRAIEAGQEAGGDSRGMQSAALFLVKEGGGYGGYNDRYCDLRVDDHESPIAELRRIFDLWKWYALIVEGYTRAEKGEWEVAFELARKLIALKPDVGESWYHPACFYSKANRREEALRHLGEAVKRDPSLGTRARADSDFSPLKEDGDFLRLTGGDDEKGN